MRLIIFCTSGGNGEEALLVPLRNKLGNVFKNIFLKFGTVEETVLTDFLMTYSLPWEPSPGVCSPPSPLILR